MLSLGVTTDPDKAEKTARLEKCEELRRLRVRAGQVTTPPIDEFVASCLIVEKETGRLIPFDLWDEQREALRFLVDNPFAVAVKGRQIGMTWLVLALMLYEGRFGGHRAFPIARQSEGYAKDAIRRLLTLAGYDPDSDLPSLRVLPESRMPDEWRPKILAKSVTELRADNGSTWTSHTATQSLGRGLIGYRGLADEFAFWPWPARQRKAMESGCARLDIVSTGNGPGDDFQAVWDLACAGKGKYKSLFISATADPRRDDEWFRLNVDEDADPDMARREYARIPEEAFRAPEGAYFKRFSRDMHVQEVEIVNNWPTVRCVDFGYRRAACLWIQESPAGRPFVVDELCPENTTTTEFADAVAEREAGWGLIAPPRITYCDPAGKQVNVQTAESEFEVFQSRGLRPYGHSSSVRDGCVRLMDLLAAPEEEQLVVSDRCVGLVSAFANVKPHRSRGEVYDFDHEIYSHPLDALRYWAVNRRAGKSTYRRPASDHPLTAGMIGREF